MDEETKQFIKEEMERILTGKFEDLLQDSLKNSYGLEAFVERLVLNKNLQILDARNIQLGRTNGTQLGTASDQLLGLWGTTPVNQPDAIADSSVGSVTGGDTVSASAVATNFTNLNTKINAILAALRESGNIDT